MKFFAFIFKLHMKNCCICFCRYDDILINGLPDWRQPVFYYRRALSLVMIGLLAFVECLFICLIATYMTSFFTTEKSQFPVYNSEIENPPGSNLSNNRPLKERFQTLTVKASSSLSCWFSNKEQKYQSPKWSFGG